MDLPRHPVSFALALMVALAAPARARPAPADTAEASPDFAALEARQAAANARPGPRVVPGRAIPAPGDVCPEPRRAIATPHRAPAWNLAPKNAQEWKQKVAELAAATASVLPGLREKPGVTSQEAVVGGVRAWSVQPKELPPENRDRLLVHVHGGGYVYNPGEAGTVEAVLMAGYGKFKVASFDCRMPPDFSYPATMDDAMAVWKAASGMQKPENMAIFGTSTGGATTPALVLRAKREGLPPPGAIAPGTPWPDLAEVGDSSRRTGGSTTSRSATTATSAVRRNSTPAATT